MSKGYWIVRVTVRDPKHYPDYLAAAQAAFSKYNATFLVRGGDFETMEGHSRERNVVVEFNDRKTAIACYHSPEYQAAKLLRQKYAETDFLIIEGAGSTMGESDARDNGTSALPQTTSKPQGFLRRVFEALGRSRERHAELYLGRSLNVPGGRLTDDLERRLVEREIQNGWF
jgi:uncharacterized protein (DUF1330 family)